MRLRLRERSPTSWLIAVLAGVLSASFGCSRAPEVGNDDFVGKWRSSRSTTPLHLNTHGEWQIRTEEGVVLQYGVWEYRDGKIVWAYKTAAGLASDPNDVLAVQRKEFKLREKDGSITTFSRIE